MRERREIESSDREYLRTCHDTCTAAGFVRTAGVAGIGWLDERTRAKVLILSGDGSKEIRAMVGDECFNALPKSIGGECVCMPADQVPGHGDGCMMGHPQLVAFIQCLRAKRKNRNTII